MGQKKRSGISVKPGVSDKLTTTRATKLIIIVRNKEIYLESRHRTGHYDNSIHLFHPCFPVVSLVLLSSLHGSFMLVLTGCPRIRRHVY